MTRAGATPRVATLLMAAAVWLGAAASPSPLEARPTYFENFVAFYGITPSDDLHACGVCHFLWTGTGARNPFGDAFQQQIYVGKSITQSLMDIEGDDTDSDGFTNLDEIMAMTLPGYNCTNFTDAIGAPTDYHTYITPGVASCLEPHDVRIAPSSVSYLTEAGEAEAFPVEIFNNGTDFPVEVSAIEIVAGSDPEFTVSGATAPLSIAVGTSVIVDVVFSPVGTVFATGTFRVTSDDPDEPTVDVPLNGFGFVDIAAPPEQRRECLGDVDKRFRKYSKTQLREWSRCYGAEVNGVACDAGARDIKLDKAAAKLRTAIGGAKDKRCKGAGLNANLLDLPSECGGSCSDISLGSIADFADCLICRQDEAMAGYMTDTIGATPPDLPPNTITDPDASDCEARFMKAGQKALAAVLKVVGACELDNVTAASPQDCSVAEAAALAKIRAKIEAVPSKCESTLDLAGCLFEPMADPACLGLSIEAIGTALVDQAIAFED